MGRSTLSPSQDAEVAEVGMKDPLWRHDSSRRGRSSDHKPCTCTKGKIPMAEEERCSLTVARFDLKLQIDTQYRDLG